MKNITHNEEALHGYGGTNDFVSDRVPEQIIGFEGFRIVELASGEDFKVSVAPKNKYFFLLSGAGEYVVGNVAGPLSTNSVLFVAFDQNFEFHCTEDCVVVILTFSALLKESADYLDKLAQRFSHSHLSYNPVLPLNDPIILFGRGIYEMVKREKVTPWYTELKRREIFYLIINSYTTDQILSFFYPQLEQRNSFRSIIIHNCDRVRNVDDLIKLTGICRTNFYRRFNTEFGMPIHRWIQQRNAYAVRELAAVPGMTVKRMMQERGFATASNFIRFCRQYFGCTPIELIQQCRKDRNESLKANN